MIGPVIHGIDSKVLLRKLINGIDRTPHVAPRPARRFCRSAAWLTRCSGTEMEKDSGSATSAGCAPGGSFAFSPISTTSPVQALLAGWRCAAWSPSTF